MSSVLAGSSWEILAPSEKDSHALEGLRSEYYGIQVYYAKHHFPD